MNALSPEEYAATHIGYWEQRADLAYKRGDMKNGNFYSAQRDAALHELVSCMTQNTVDTSSINQGLQPNI